MFDDFSDDGSEALGKRPPRFRPGPSKRRVLVKVEYNSEDEAMAVDPPNRPGRVFAKSETHVQAALSRNHIAVTGEFRPPARRYHVVHRVEDIEYKPGGAIFNQCEMVESIEDVLELVEFPQTLRSDALRAEAKNVKESVAEPVKKIIAVLGATGVGKSSLINALLGDFIVPSSSLSACTSVPTEIAYHKGEDISADIFFIPRQDWRKFITLVLDDHAFRHARDEDEEDEGSQEPNDSDGPVEVAWQKFRAVYPGIEPGELSEMTVDDVIAMNPTFWNMLGTTKRIVFSDPDLFRDEITQYVGSGSYQSNTESQDSDEEMDTPKIPSQIWPLVKKVVIYYDADILAGGGVSFVDLPGVADTNTARDNAAKEYMKNATHFWILTLSNRAVNDKTAHELLGDALKTQLQLDGNLNAHSISLITTKNDQLTVSEVVRQLKLSKDPEFIELQNQIQLASELEDLEEQERDCSEHIEALRRGEDYVPKYFPGGSKRTRQSGKAGSSSNRRSARNVGSAASSRGSRTGKGKHGDGVDDHITLIDLERKRATLNESIEGIRARLHETLETLQRMKKAFCAARRSEYAGKKIKASFRDLFEGMGLNDETQINIPVFACSSADYLKLTGCCPDDGGAECFVNVTQTGIPRIRQFVQEISKSTRHEQAISGFSQVRAFARTVSAFAQVAQDISPTNRAILRARWETTDHRELPIRWYYHEVGEENVGISRRLKREFSDAAEEFLAGLQKHCKDALEYKCGAGAEQASKSAPESLMQFVGSLQHWRTYGAVLRRDGHWEKRSLNLNYVLTEPIKSSISQSWAALFSSLPFDKLEARILELLSQLFEEFYESAPDAAKARAKLHSDICLEAMKGLLPRAFAEPKNLLAQAQKTISRSLDTHVSDQLCDVYAEAGAMTGRGMFRRQKNRLREHLKKHGRAIFNSAVDALLIDVNNALVSAVDSLGKSLDEFAVKVEMDLSVLWEVFNRDAPQVRARQYLATLATEIQGQVQLWLEAVRSMERAQEQVMSHY